jgi:hypothetical protein
MQGRPACDWMNSIGLRTDVPAGIGRLAKIDR